MIDLFSEAGNAAMIARIDRLSPNSKALWGKMNVAQMLAHCCVSYDMTFDSNYPRPNFFVRTLLNLFIKSAVVGPKPYQKNGRTAPQFIINDERDFATEKKRLVKNIEEMQKLGPEYFISKDYPSFGKLTKNEWNIMFSKHIDHHLRQFGV